MWRNVGPTENTSNPASRVYALDVRCKNPGYDSSVVLLLVVFRVTNYNTIGCTTTKKCITAPAFQKVNKHYKWQHCGAALRN